MLFFRKSFQISKINPLYEFQNETFSNIEKLA